MQPHQLIKILILVFSLTVNMVYGQATTWKLQKIELKDTFMIREIEKLIVWMEEKDSSFANGLGYIKVYERLTLEEGIA